MKNCLLLFLLALVASMLSCVNEFAYESESNFEDSLNISGQFTNDSSHNFVVVSKSSSFEKGEPTIPDPICDAEVYVIENGSNRINFKCNFQGYYKSDIKGRVGNTYKLVVKYNNEEYVSTEHPMLPNATIDSARFYPKQDLVLLSSGNIATQDIVQIRLTTQLNASKPLNTYYRFLGYYEFVEEYALKPRKCYVEDRADIGQVHSLRGDAYPNNKVEDVSIFNIIHDHKFKYKYVARIDQYSIDSITQQYWAKVKQITKVDRSIFDPPPASIGNNIGSVSGRNRAYGFFTVASVKSKYINTDSQRLNFYTKEFCSAAYRSECFDCTLFPKSSLVKPNFWPKP